MLVGEVKDFADFESKVESVQKPKKERAPKAKAPAIEGEVTAGSIVALALGLWQELEDATLDTPEFIAIAEQLVATVSTSIKYSKGELAKSQKAHPAKASA